MKPETIALHHGYTADNQNSVAVPIHQTTSFSFDDAQHAADLFDLKVQGNIYSRIMNPTCDVLEQRVAALEGGIAALAVSSGMAAITYTIQTLASTGDNIVSISELYGGTYNLFAHTLPRQGIDVRFADKDDFDKIESLGWKAQRVARDGVIEICAALDSGALDKTTKTITLDWYKTLADWHKRIKEIERYGGIIEI